MTAIQTENVLKSRFDSNFGYEIEKNVKNIEHRRHVRYWGQQTLYERLPFRVNSVSCRPRSTNSPSFNTRISSAWMIVESRWATIIVVRSVHTCDKAAWIFRSVCVSSDDVASSSSTMAGDFKIVRADWNWNKNTKIN